MSHKFPWEWHLKDGYPAKGVPKNKYVVFGTFICGGGSTMGYKLAGFNHIGGVEVDKKIATTYRLNHKPDHLYTEDIREFNKRTDLPDDLYNLDILDGSPPCSTFSIAGSRENAWGLGKKFREGQKNQILDDLVFVYCETILKLKPKVFILENVKGIIQGNAKVYSKEIVKKLTFGGYKVQVFLLNAASMGVPQRRERVFFIGHKKEINLQKLRLNFSETPVTYKEIKSYSNILKHKLVTEQTKLWHKVGNKEKFSKGHPKRHFFGDFKLSINSTLSTIIAHTSNGDWCNDICRLLDKDELCKGGTYPLDYDFNGNHPKYLIGMSVPPVMIAQIANQIKIQWLDKI